MKYLKLFESFDKEGKRISSNVIQFDIEHIDDDVVKKFQMEYPDKWILPSPEYGYIFVKDKPVKYVGYLPNKVYHVSPNGNLEQIGIKTSTETESPFGYYNLTFFYLNIEEAEWGSKPYMEGKNYLYEIDTDATDNWTNPINKPIDEEDNVTTPEFIDKKYVKLIK